MKKQTKVLVAAAMLTMGASFSSMAALKNGTWVPEDGTWQYADRNGDIVYETWVEDAGVEYYMDEDGYLAQSRWVEDEDGYMYYVLSDGAKLKNEWKELYAYGEEEVGEIGEKSWFYFDTKGRMLQNNRKKIEDKYYVFGEDGKMLTGWVDINTYETVNDAPAHLATGMVYCNDDGDVATGWQYLLPWSYDVNETYEDIDDLLEYYYADADGDLTVGKSSSIEGFTYFFDSHGEMLTGWVAPVWNAAEENEAKNVTIVDLNNDDSFEPGDDYLKGAYAPATAIDTTNDTYNNNLSFACDRGYMHNSEWRKLASPEGKGDFWYWFDSKGVVYTADDNTGAAVVENTEFQYATLYDGELYATGYMDADKVDDGEIDNVGLALESVFDAGWGTGVVNLRNVKGELYHFTNQGRMLEGLLKVVDTEEKTAELMYLHDGVRFAGITTFTDANENEYEFAFAPEGSNNDAVGSGYKRYTGITGQYKGRLYKDGQLVTAMDDDVYLVMKVYDKNQPLKDGGFYAYTFLVDEKGKVVTRDGKYLVDDYGHEIEIKVNKDSSRGPWRYSVINTEVTDGYAEELDK